MVSTMSRYQQLRRLGSANRSLSRTTLASRFRRRPEASIHSIVPSATERPPWPSLPSAAASVQSLPCPWCPPHQAQLLLSMDKEIWRLNPSHPTGIRLLQLSPV